MSDRREETLKQEHEKLSLYSDFKLTEENCDVEPIHRPRAIQGYGQMLVFDESDLNHLLAMSSGIPALLGRKEEELWQSPVQAWMPPIMLKIYGEMEIPINWDSVDPIPFELNGVPLNMIRHMHANRCFIEIEPKADNLNVDLSTFRAIRIVTEPFRHIQNLDELYREFTYQYKKVTGYDRVMVYQFDQDYHGYVVGEAREDHLESFLGLHYPATDIPKMARDLFLLNRSRTIPDVHCENNWLYINPNRRQPVAHLDLTYTQLRATSPIHVEYLKNMGVGGSFTLAIVIENNLWGLVACHHYSPHFMSYEMRKTGELIANSLAQRIVEITQHQYHERLRHYVDKEIKFLSSIDISTDLSVQLVDTKPDLTELYDSDGCAVVTANAGMYSLGLAPSKEVLLQIKEWLLKEKHKQIYYTDHVAHHLPADIPIPSEVGGILSIAISSWDETFVLWFRRSQKNIFQWGGDPNQPYEIDHLENGEIRLSPRKSFEKWKDQVDTKAIPWDKTALDMANHVREGLLRKEVERQAQRAKVIKSDYEQLTYVASHDLQEPLRTVTNYLNLLAEELEAGDHENFKHYMQRTHLATSRMKTLIQDMLEYSRLGRNGEPGWMPVEEIVREVMEDMQLLITETQASIHWEKLPSIKGNKSELKQLFQNMINNAIKYRREDAPPSICIGSEHVGHYWTFSIADNGIGIDPAYFDRIFLLFQRLHGKDEYAGTGIGLSHCKRIIDSLEGRIWVTSKLGKGSTFWFSLHESIVKNNDNKTPTDLTH